MGFTIDTGHKGRHRFICWPSLELIIGTVVFLALETGEIRRGRRQFMIKQMFVSFLLFMDHVAPFVWIQLLVCHERTQMRFFHAVYHGMCNIEE